jgi:C4-dicarboxylate transporter, DctM subunit
MTPVQVGGLGLVALIVLLFSGLPIGLVMAVVGLVGFSYLKDFSSGVALLGAVPFATFANYGFSVLPLFVLMGELCYFAKISGELYDTTYKWIGHLPGGLAIASVGACAGFAAICGSGVACTATMGTVAIPEMKRYRYDASLATGCIATGGTLGVMIPPSLGFVIYGIIAEQSIGKLFVAGIIPGILQALLFMGTIYTICKRNPLAGLPGPHTSWREKFRSLRGIWIVLALFSLVMGGIYLGLFSPTEAAGVGAFGAFVFAIATKRLTFQNYRQSLNATMRTTAMGFLILAGAMVFGYFLAVSRLPVQLASMIQGLHLNGYVLIGVIVLLYLFLGCIMDTIAMVVLTVPIFLPLMNAYGFDLIWFGVLVTLMGEIGGVTPPVGINVFVIQGIAKDVPMYTVFKGIGTFVLADLVLVVVLVAFPIIATFLPTTMFNPLG